MITKSLTQILTGIRAARGTVETPSTLIPDSELTDWANEHVRELWSQLAPICRDEFTTLSANQTVTSAATFDLSTLTGPPAFLALRGVDRDVGGGVFKKIRPWRFGARSWVSEITYHVVGKVVRIEPAILAAGTYRFWYIGAPTDWVVGSPSVTIDFPLGGDRYVIQGCAAQVRARMEEDPAPHLALQERALQTARRYIVQHNQGDQEAVTDVYDDYDIGGW